MKRVFAGALVLGFLAACDKAGTGNTCASSGGVVVDTRDTPTFDPALFGLAWALAVGPNRLPVLP